MASTTAHQMDAVEIEKFLGSRETGVLSLARDDDGYGFPVSFAYDEDTRDVFFRFGWGPSSESTRQLDAADRASLVVYERNESRWKSVVARGTVRQLTGDTLESTVVEADRELQIPYVTVRERERSGPTFHLGRLAVETMEGTVER